MTDKGADWKPAWPEWAGCVWFLLLCFGGAGGISAFTVDGLDGWYHSLKAPAFTPPDLVFPLAWSTLYVLIAVSGWRLWMRRDRDGGRLALIAWALQLALNFAWPILFFGLHMIGPALVEIAAMAAAIALTMVLALGVDRPAAWLLAPYLAWVGFASVLNFAFLRLN